MRYPPSLSWRPQCSSIYAGLAVLLTLFLIALCAHFTWSSERFSFKNYLLIELTTIVSLWLLYDAFRQPKGQLSYAQGVWTWQKDSQDIQGTCVLHLDLQSYMLVSYVASADHKRLLPKTTQWFHLEARHAEPSGSPGQWLALRRAVHASVGPAHEAVVA